MKWGRKKSFLFPVSWFSKLKHKDGNNLDSKSKQRCLYNFSTPNSSGWKQGRFYSMDEDDPYWRLSFGEERIQGRRSTGGINNPLWCDDVDHEFQIPVSDFRSFELTEMEVPRRDEFRNFNEMVSDIKRMKERRGTQRILAEKNGAFGGKNGDGKAGVSTRRRNDVNDQITRKMRGVDDGAEKISILGERDIFPIENMVYDSRKQRKNTNIDQRSVSGWQDFGDMKLKEIKIKPESKKKSANINRESHSRRPVKASSPRIECKIRALEEMKKARTKSKKKDKKEKVLEGNTIFDSFAVVKSSYDPQQDFRDSMVEMIREKGIGHAEDLEELLACYLTLNCDEYHDLIIKVFRQVWLEMEGVCIDPPLQNGAYFDY